ncbi:carboxylating nicotinate-nucleotide diphosphorylase [Desulforegula conservatrix]|uniref:carboxylating nicotinate-nucleotide diphosphorylase n=1 Tax=Desulforegula conservatrix TaxID=153026 RepID=UPI000400FAC3|nr:carboxylating nicotinate-nucleotide diphosphorylase [Desulforegula conservatrix]
MNKSTFSQSGPYFSGIDMNIHVEKLIQLALEEDLGPGDITTQLLVSKEKSGLAEIVAKEDLILAGSETVEAVFKKLDIETMVKFNFIDGEFITNGSIIAEISGKLTVLLEGERTALNFLQRLCGIATHVRAYIAEMGDSGKTRLVDTRKTTPGWRVLEKYAVRVGGAGNHRIALYDGILIKDNHIAVCGGVKKAVETARANAHHLLKIEVEVTNMQELGEALDAGADVIMLDNMNDEQILAAVKTINGRALVEVSGMVRKDRLAFLSNTGVDIVSSGALTHQAKSVDISMRIISKD